MADSESDMPEARRSPRSRTFKGGSIIFGVAAAIDCIIRNMSESGAALEIESPVGIPDEFILIVKPEFVKRNCRVAWRSAKRIGVAFV
ncbi:MAG TPA: PilZ domain-containing protein [Pseudolabrys sp.]|nr:PilZ domain-containing protein [Pseudolabrys sp.]